MTFFLTRLLPLVFLWATLFHGSWSATSRYYPDTYAYYADEYPEVIPVDVAPGRSYQLATSRYPSVLEYDEPAIITPVSTSVREYVTRTHPRVHYGSRLSPYLVREIHEIKPTEPASTPKNRLTRQTKTEHATPRYIQGWTGFHAKQPFPVTKESSPAVYSSVPFGTITHGVRYATNGSGYWEEYLSQHPDSSPVTTAQPNETTEDVSSQGDALSDQKEQPALNTDADAASVSPLPSTQPSPQASKHAASIFDFSVPLAPTIESNAQQKTSNLNSQQSAQSSEANGEQLWSASNSNSKTSRSRQSVSDASRNSVSNKKISSVSDAAVASTGQTSEEKVSDVQLPLHLPEDGDFIFYALVFDTESPSIQEVKFTKEPDGRVRVGLKDGDYIIDSFTLYDGSPLTTLWNKQGDEARLLVVRQGTHEGFFLQVGNQQLGIVDKRHFVYHQN